MSLQTDRQDEDAVRSELRERVARLVESVDLRTVDTDDFLAARFDAGLAWVHFPVGAGGLGLAPGFQEFVVDELRAPGAPDQPYGRNGIGLSMAAPTIAICGNAEQQQRLLRPLWTAEHEYCQLFSEPDAGSDLAAVATRAVRDGDEWVINGQKVWSSSAHNAQRAILVARTDPEAPKHKGLTYFICDMTVPGVDVRPLRQITGEAEFNEVFLTDVRIADRDRIGEIGDGWKVATTTLNNERVVFGSGHAREDSMIGPTVREWRTNAHVRDPNLHDELIRLWVEAEVSRLAAERLAQSREAGQPGPEGSAVKLSFARVAQAISGFEMQMRRDDGLRYDEWTMKRPELVDVNGRGPGYRYLRAKGNSMEGGTSEILRNIIAERVLELPREQRTDKDLPWKDVPR